MNATQKEILVYIKALYNIFPMLYNVNCNQISIDWLSFIPS